MIRCHREEIMHFRLMIVALAALVWLRGSAGAETLVERGDYLVNGILTCGNCHTPRGPGGVFDNAKRLSGGPQVFDEPAFTVRGSNITPHKETGIGSWSAAELKRALQDGVRPNGVPLAPIMPSAYYRVFTPRDMDAVVAYLRSVPPVANAVPAPVYKTNVTGVSPPGADKQMSEADLADPVRRGFYLVTIGHCMECHTPMSGGRHDFSRLGAGGQNFPGPWGTSTARNITPHPDKGLGSWSDEDIKKAITQGIARDGSRLKPPMGYGLYARLTPDDLSAIVAYLRTVPAKE
jgi:mono/diheme cytochrome c family protein